MAPDDETQKTSEPNHSDFSVNQNIHRERQALMNEFAGKALSFRTQTLMPKNIHVLYLPFNT